MKRVPAWIWLPGSTTPTLAAHLEVVSDISRWVYTPEYLARADKLAADPVTLRLSRKARGSVVPFSDGLPGVARDACPAGYGADRLVARAGKMLTPLELLEAGPSDAVGALEICAHIERKMAWQANSFDALRGIIESMDALAPASRAIRQLQDDAATSAGGERPKATVSYQGGLWLAKMQDRADVPAMPAREYTAMRLAQDAGLNVPAIGLHTIGPHQVFMIERFDRAGAPARPQRRLYASAHTVLQLEPSAVPGDPRRSYLVLADRMQVWCGGKPDMARDLAELWQRMAFNALVGNVDDHPRNHGLLHDGQHWGLSPLFDVTPVARRPNDMPARPAGGAVVLSMCTGLDDASDADAVRLLACCERFGLTVDEAARWLKQTSAHVASRWETTLRQAARPVMPDASRLDALVNECAYAFGLSEDLAGHPEIIDRARDAALARPARVRSGRVGR